LLNPFLKEKVKIKKVKNISKSMLQNYFIPANKLYPSSPFLHEMVFQCGVLKKKGEIFLS
jgi:hypothetical protein